MPPARARAELALWASVAYHPPFAGDNVVRGRWSSGGEDEVEAFVRIRFTLLLALLVLAVPGTARAATDLTTEVNPFIGTQDFGNTFPGASMPFGMVQVSPDNGGQGGYDYSRDYISGISQTHLSG